MRTSGALACIGALIVVAACAGSQSFDNGEELEGKDGGGLDAAAVKSEDTSDAGRPETSIESGGAAAIDPGGSGGGGGPSPQNGGSGGADPQAGGSGGALGQGGGPSDPVAHGTGEGDLVLQYRRGGGSSAAAYEWLEIPTVAVYGDGRVVFTTERENPSTASIRETRFSEDQLQSVLVFAREHGLLGGSSESIDDGVPEGDTATLEITTAAGCTTHVAYPGSTAGYLDLVSLLFDLIGPGEGGPGAKPYEYTHVRLDFDFGSTRCDGSTPWPFDSPQGVPALQRWPRFCHVATVEEAGALVPVGTPGGGAADGGLACVRYTIRPLYPGEPHCVFQPPVSAPHFPTCSPP